MTRALVRNVVFVLLLVLPSAILLPGITQASTNSPGIEQTDNPAPERFTGQSEQETAAAAPEHEGFDDAVAWLVLIFVVGMILVVWSLIRGKAKLGSTESTSSKTATGQKDEGGRSSKGAKASIDDEHRTTKNEVAEPSKDKPATNRSVPPTPAADTAQQEADTEYEEKEKAKKSSGPQRIGYTPSGRFIQQEPYVYPVAKMPRPGCVVKFPRKGGRTGNRGFTEEAFESHVRRFFDDHVKVYNDRRMVISAGKRPYEPDLVLSNEEAGRNLFIDIEVDEPYSGSSTPEPTHCIGEDEQRDNFFVHRGWIVIRFAEFQVHADPRVCCRFIAEVIKSAWPQYSVPSALDSATVPDPVEQWSSDEAEEWARNKYRERYLGISSFGDQDQDGGQPVGDETSAEADAEVHVQVPSIVPRERDEQTTADRWQHPRDAHIRFHSENHQYYIHGSSDVVSVTELAQSFFPEFDSKRVSERIANRANHPNSKYFGMTAQAIRAKWEKDAKASRVAGTALHEAVTQKLKGTGVESALPAMRHFSAFMQDHHPLEVCRTEWRIYDEEAMVAGTLDALFQDESGRLVLCDWTRSKKIKRENDWQNGLTLLSHLPDANYWHKAVQLSLYAAILQDRYDCSVDRQYLVGLHPQQDSYQKFELPTLLDEASALLDTRRG
jgi:hypothetical protein